MDMKTGDQELALAAAAGDPAAFERLLDRHYDTILRLARRSCANPADAEDVAQDICLALARTIQSFRGQSAFSTWLYRVVLNRCRDRHRQLKSTEKAVEAFAEHDALARDEHRERQQQIAWLYETLNELDTPLKETALLVVGEGLNHRDAGEILSVSESTISWRMHKLKGRLQKLAAEQE